MPAMLPPLYHGGGNGGSVQNGEYLGIIKKLAKCRDDDGLNLVQQELQDFLNRHLVGGGSSKFRFCERYIHGDASLHVHGFFTIDPSIGDRIELCAILDSTNAGIPPTCGFDPFFRCKTRFGEVEVSVLVDVREIGQQPKDVPCAVASIRLHSLDECKRLFGNPRQDVRETVVGRGLLRQIKPQGEKTVLLPVGGQLDVSGVELDEIESQVVDGRSELIQSLSRQDGDFRRGILKHAYLLFAIRLRDSFVRITSGIGGDVFSYGFDVLRYPDEFETGGFDTAEHATS